MSGTFDIALLTDARYVRPRNPDRYVQNILDDDALITAALKEHHGLRAVRVDWADPTFDWASVRAAVFRTTWDYFERIHEFRAWIDRARTQTRLMNPVELVRWNLDKHYLLDMHAKGIHIPPTRIVKKGGAVSLIQAMKDLKSQEIIVKPTISGASRHTYRVTEGNAAEVELKINALLEDEDFLLQPFLHSVLKEGEISLMVIGDQVTHAIRKLPKAGDFRVQDDHGGTAEIYEATPEEIAFARQATAICTPASIYARVDIVRDNAGKLALMEWEGIEPELFLRHYPKSAEYLAEAIAGALP